MSNPNALFLLADHIKLSLLERKRAQSLSLDAGSQDGHISRSLDQFREGLETLEKEQKRLEEAGDEDKALDIEDSLHTLQQQLEDLTSQFHGFSSVAPSTPNDPSLAPDFEAANTVPAAKTKQVRFSDNPASGGSGRRRTDDDDLEAQRSGLLGQPYRDDPESGPSFRDQVEEQGIDNVQVHAYHQRVMEDQDAQLDALGASISRQRELSMQIGDELDSQVAMLDESERVVDRHQGSLDRARRQVGKISRSAGESKQMLIIIALIVILVLLIAIFK